MNSSLCFLLVYSSEMWNPKLRSSWLAFFVCLFLWWAGVGPITEYSCDKPVPVFLSAMAKKQTPPIESTWCYHTGASLNGKPDWKPPISMHVLYWPFHKVKGRKNLFPIPCFRASQHRDWVMACQTNYPVSRTWFSIVSGSSKPGSPSNIPFSYHSNPFLRKFIVKRRRFLTNLVVGLEYPPPVRAVWLKLICTRY